MPSNYRDFTAEAREALRTAENTDRDDLAVQKKLRMEALDRAETAISRAREAIQNDEI